jgi:hypothetical protein
MSVEVILIPLGIAAFGAISTLVKEARSNDLCEKCKATRVTDRSILLDALVRMGAVVRSDESDRVLADGPWGSLTFQRVGDVFLGRVDGDDEHATQSMLEELDANVGRVVQGRTAAQLVERAEALGLRLIEHRDEDGELRYVFEAAT